MGKDLGLVFLVVATSGGVSTIKLTSYCLAAIDLLQNYPVFLNSFSGASAAQLTDVESLEPSQGTQQGCAARVTGIIPFDKNVILGQFKIMVKFHIFLQAGGRWDNKFLL